MTMTRERQTATAMPGSTPRNSVPRKATTHKNQSARFTRYNFLASAMATSGMTELMTMAASTYLGK